MTTEALEDDLYNGLKIVCDQCDHIGSNDHGYPFWQLQEDGRVLCIHCAEEPTNDN
jgi:hypothetical protein